MAKSDENIEGTSSSSSVFAPAADGAGAVAMWEKRKMRLGRPGHCLPLWFKADCETQRLQVVHLIQIYSHRALEKYSKILRGLENTTLERFTWRVQSDSDGVALSSPLSRKKKVCKHQPYAKRCILNVQRHKTHPLIIACT